VSAAVSTRPWFQPGKWTVIAAAAVVFAFQFLPVAVVVLFSFNESRSVISFTGFSTAWYGKTLSNPDILSATAVSSGIALGCAVLSILIGVPLAIGVHRLRSREAAVPNVLIGLVFTTPEIAMGVSLLLLFSSVGMSLSPWTILLGHVTFSLSYVVLLVRARLTALRRDIEEAAADLGASRWQVLTLVILPQLWPTMLVASMLVFLLSFDDFVTSFFVSGLDKPTLPIYIYGMLRRGLTPEINVIGTMMIVIALVLAGIGFLVAARSRERSVLQALG
jgi:spermidine/putrescine transport system permease protein